MSDEPPPPPSPPSIAEGPLPWERPRFTVEPAVQHQLWSFDAAMAVGWLAFGIVINIVGPGLIGMLIASTGCAFALRAVGRARSGERSLPFAALIFAVAAGGVLFSAVHWVIRLRERIGR